MVYRSTSLEIGHDVSEHKPWFQFSLKQLLFGTTVIGLYVGGVVAQDFRFALPVLLAFVFFIPLWVFVGLANRKWTGYSRAAMKGVPMASVVAQFILCANVSQWYHSFGRRQDDEYVSYISSVGGFLRIVAWELQKISIYFPIVVGGACLASVVFYFYAKNIREAKVSWSEPHDPLE